MFKVLTNLLQMVQMLYVQTAAKDFFVCKTHGFHFHFLQNIFPFYLFIFREKGREGEREEEKHLCVVASHMARTGDLACNPGMCPDWESNQQPLALQAHAPFTELHQPGLLFHFLNVSLKHKVCMQG